MCSPSDLPPKKLTVSWPSPLGCRGPACERRRPQPINGFRPSFIVCQFARMNSQPTIGKISGAQLVSDPGAQSVTFAKHFSTLPLTLRPLSIQPFVITLSSYDAGAALRTLRAPTAAHKPSAEVMRNAAQSLRVTQRWLRGHAVLVCVRECAVLRHSVQFDRRASGVPVCVEYF